MAPTEAEADPGRGIAASPDVATDRRSGVPARPDAQADSGAAARGRSWLVRQAVPDDTPAVVAAVSELLCELGGSPPPIAAMEAAARGLLEGPSAGAVLVAEGGDGAGGVGSLKTLTSASAGEGDGAVVVDSSQTLTGASAREPAVAPPTGLLVGVLGMSWQSAIHTPGRYALIQDLWVAPDWRGSGVGAGLLAALFALVREREVARVEVGLPRETFPGIAATEAFYIASGFTALGARMRRDLV